MSSTGAVADDRHVLLHAGRPELEIERQFLADGERHLRVFDDREARLLGGDCVCGRLQRAGHEEALSLLRTVRVSPVLSFFTLTVAPATKAPLESLTVPLMRPSVCAAASEGSRANISAANHPSKHLH